MSIISTPVVYQPPLTGLADVGSLRVTDKVKQVIAFPVANLQQINRGGLAQGKFLRGNKAGGLGIDLPDKIHELETSCTEFTLPTGATETFTFDAYSDYIGLRYVGQLGPGKAEWALMAGAAFIQFIEETAICIKARSKEILVHNWGVRDLTLWVWQLNLP